MSTAQNRVCSFPDGPGSPGSIPASAQAASTRCAGSAREGRRHRCLCAQWSTLGRGLLLLSSQGSGLDSCDTLAVLSFPHPTSGLYFPGERTELKAVWGKQVTTSDKMSSTNLQDNFPPSAWCFCRVQTPPPMNLTCAQSKACGLSGAFFPSLTRRAFLSADLWAVGLLRNNLRQLDKLLVTK